MSEPQHAASSADQPATGASMGRTPAGSSPPRSGWSARILPFVPIVGALAVVLLVRQFRSVPAAPVLSELAVGAAAPDFALRDAQKEDREPVALARLVQKGPVVIIFHKGLHCPVCAAHLMKFAEQIEDFRKAGIQVVAISPESPAETRAGVESWGAIPFPLLTDADDQVARAYGLETPDGGFLDGTFVIDRERRVALALKSNEPVGDIAELLEAGTGSKRRP